MSYLDKSTVFTVRIKLAYGVYYGVMSAVMFVVFYRRLEIHTTRHKTTA